MNKNIMRLFVFLITIMMMSCTLISCGESKNSNSNEVTRHDQETQDTEDTSVKEPKAIDIEFRDIKLTIPAGYEYDNDTFKKDLKRYKKLDESGNQVGEITISYSDQDEGNILKPDTAEEFCGNIVEADLGIDYDGYETTSIDDKLSALKYQYRIIDDNRNINVMGVSFNDEAGHVYSITSKSESNPENDLNSIIDTIDYTFDVYKDKYDLKLEVEFESNWFLDIYDVDIYVDDDKVGSISQGNSVDLIVSVKEGDHDIRFEKYDDYNVVADIMSCHSSVHLRCQ